MKNINDKLKEWEYKLYGINSIISLRWIGMKEKPIEEQIIQLNKVLGELIKDIRNAREGNEDDEDIKTYQDNPIAK